MVLLHGYGSDGETQGRYLQLRAATDRAGMLLAEPDGTRDGTGHRFWNATDACCGRPGSPVDDSAYLSAMIKNIAVRYNLDHHRVFIIGHSNGAFMAYKMACNHADQIVGIVSFEGAMSADPRWCKPTRAVAVLEVHGTADAAVRYDGGRVANGFKPYAGAVATVQIWARLDSCKTVPDHPSPSSKAIEQGQPPATIQTYSARCAPGGHAELWTQPGGIHKPILTASFSDQLIRFLLRYRRP